MIAKKMTQEGITATSEEPDLHSGSSLESETSLTKKSIFIISQKAFSLFKRSKVRLFPSHNGRFSLS